MSGVNGKPVWEKEYVLLEIQRLNRVHLDVVSARVHVMASANGVSGAPVKVPELSVALER